MGPIRIDPQKAMDEALKFNQRIAASFKTLRSLDEVDYGVTSKEEIYREDKLVLYRFKGAGKPTAKVPLLIVYGDADRLLPVAENSVVVYDRYRALGGPAERVVKPGQDHHPHGLADVTPVVRFFAAARDAGR